VKIGASEESAGLALSGPSGTKDTYVQLGAKGNASSLTLRNEDGESRSSSRSTSVMRERMIEEIDLNMRDLLNAVRQA